MSATLLEQDREDEIRYRSAIVQLLAFSIDKLNDKGRQDSHLLRKLSLTLSTWCSSAVYANTLVLSGRILGESFTTCELIVLCSG